MRYNTFNYKKLTLATAIAFFLFFSACVFLYEKYENNRAYLRIQQHAVVISNSLWNLNPEGIKEYLLLACKSHNYKIITVIDTKGNIFESAADQTIGWSERFFSSINLIPEITLKSDIFYNGHTLRGITNDETVDAKNVPLDFHIKGKKIGSVEAIWQCDTIYLELYLLLAIILTYSICHLNLRLINSKNLLEQRVEERTMELFIANASLQVELEAHQKAREALGKSEEKYRILVENIPDILYRTDMAGKILFISRSSENILGYTPEEITGGQIAELFYPNPDERNTFIEALEQKGYINNYEEQLKRKDGSLWWASVNAHFFRDTSDNIVGIEGVFRDITENKILESELRQAQKMESIGTLTGGIAHDFNNILNIMLGNAELAINDIPEWSPAHSKIEAIRTAGHKASGIVRQLLSFSRKTEMELKPIDIIPVLKESIQLLRATIPSTIKIIDSIPSDIKATILGHPTQIHQIIINLCINASQAMEDIEGTIEIRVENRITYNKSENGLYDLKTDGYVETGEYVRITVTDTGRGIDPEIIDKIFDPYFTTKPVDKGTGMGLAVVHGIVKNNNGVITVHSTLSEGTTFAILFPLVAQTGTNTVAQETAVLSDGLYHGTERILLVDDDEFIVDMTNEMLERLGYSVESKAEPEEALELFMANPNAFDLIITDMTMPNMTGAKLAERVRQIRADIPVIVCSGYSSLINEEKAREAGIAAYLMKPVSMQELGQAIRNVLEKVR